MQLVNTLSGDIIGGNGSAASSIDLGAIESTSSRQPLQRRFHTK